LTRNRPRARTFDFILTVRLPFLPSSAPYLCHALHLHQALTRSPPKGYSARPGSGAGSDPAQSPGGDSGDAPGGGNGGADDNDEDAGGGRGDGAGASRGASASAPGGGGFLRKKAFVDPALALPRPFVRPPPAGSFGAEAAPRAERRKSAVPRADELARAAREREAAAAAAADARGGGGGGKDFLSENARAAMAERARAAEVDPAAPLPRGADYGKLPGYLRERKEAWAAEAEARRAAELEAQGCPRGHRLMPEAERLETLALLRASCGEARDALQRMPLRVEIPSAVRKKHELEAKLTKLEEALKVFERPRVFVKIDA